MYSKLGLTLGDLKQKLEEISKYAKDDTDLYISFDGFTTNYVINKICLVGPDYPEKDDEDRIAGCPVGLEFISEDVIEQDDVLEALDSLGSDSKDICIEHLERRGGIDVILDRYGRERW